MQKRWHGGLFLEAKTTTPILLKKLNNEFLVAHHQSAKTALKNIPHVIVYHQNELSLWKACDSGYQSVEKVKIVTSHDEYTAIKTIVHIPLYIQTVLQSDLPLEKNALLVYRNDLLLLQQQLIEQKVSTQDLVNKLAVVKRTLMILETMLIKGKQEEMLTAYLQTVKPAMVYLSQRVTDIQLERFKIALDRIHKEYEVNASTCRVIVTGAHGARNGLIETQLLSQYYQKKTGVSEVLNNIVYYSESLPQHISTIDISRDLINSFLANAELNKSYGCKYAQDKTMMFKDVLSPYASSTIMRLFKKPSVCPVTALKNSVLTMFKLK